MTVAEPRTRLPASLEAPLLGSAGNATLNELALASKFDELHQLLYTRGGVRPTNAAIEEVGKLVFLRLWLARDPSATFGRWTLDGLFSGQISDAELVPATKAAFAQVLAADVMGVEGLDGVRRSLWPHDEPFRLAEPVVLRTALAIVNEIVDGETGIADPLGTAFDAFLSGRYDHSGGLGTYLTPSSVARMMAEIALDLAPVDAFTRVTGPVIADPFCGTGRFLVSAFDAIEEQGGGADLVGLLNGGIVGADQSTTAIAKSGLNLLLYGATAPRVHSVSDSITDAELKRLRGKLAIVLTNPPFGGGKYSDPVGVSNTRRVLPSLKAVGAIDPALAGLALSLDLLRPSGVLGIVLPEGIVGGRLFDDLLRDRGLHVAVSVSLPTVTFALSGTVAKTAAVFIKKSPRSERTLLARIEHVGFVRQAGRAAADPAGSEIDETTRLIRSALRASDRTVDEIAILSESPLVASVPSDGLSSVDPNRLDPDAVRSRHQLIAAGGVRLRDLMKSFGKRRGHRSKGRPFVSVLHVDSFGTVDWSEAKTYAPATAGQYAKSGDLLVSLLNPSKLRAAVVPADAGEVECSAEFGVFKSTVDPYAVLGLLYRPEVQIQLKPLGTGTSSSRRRITAEDVLDLVVPRLSSADMAQLGEEVRALIRRVEMSRVELSDLYGLS